MISNTYLHVMNHFSGVLLPILLTTLIKTSLLFAIVALLIRAFKITSEKTKYLLWVCYLFTTVLIAISTALSPYFSFTLLPISPHRVKNSMMLTNMLFPQKEAFSLTEINTTELVITMKENPTFSYTLNWFFWIICVWIIGITIGLIHTFTGKAGVVYISRNTSQREAAYFEKEISTITQNLGIKRKIKVVVSCRCRLPFTYGFIHPLLVVPYEAKDWSTSKLRTILIHELSHVRRHDYLVLSLSQFICSVFWFIPVMWFAYANIQLEQEKLCDSAAIEEGVRPTVYARYMVDLARTARTLILWSGIFMIKRRNNMLEKRVENVLGMKHSSVHEKISQRKTLFWSILTVFIVLTIAASSATGKKIISISEAMGQFEGVYVNTEYSGNVELYPQKRVIYSDGNMEIYLKATNKSAHFQTEYTIEESWSDSTGSVYSTVIVEWTPGGNTTLELWKLDRTNDTFEINFNFYSLYEDVSREYPDKIDPELDDFPESIYSVWYRQ